MAFSCTKPKRWNRIESSSEEESDNDVQFVEKSMKKMAIEPPKATVTEVCVGVRTGKKLFISSQLFEKLYDYQKDGVRWLFGLYDRGCGGILGDDMGLGKTIQVIAFLSGMLQSKLMKAAIVVSPMSVISVWEKEFQRFSPSIKVGIFHGDKRSREKALERIQHIGGVLLTTYDLVGGYAEQMSYDSLNDKNFLWDFVIADEGHNIKNKAIKRSKGCHTIATKFRIALTGTPLQNRLAELWALFDWTHFGQLLGTLKTFNSNYGHRIEEGRKKGAQPDQQRMGALFAKNLREIIDPFLLRRTKEQVGLDKKSPDSEAMAGASGDCVQLSRPIFPSLPRKNDFVIWLSLSEDQLMLYSKFLKTPDIRQLLDPHSGIKRSPLTELLVLKKICDHPRLLSENACQQLGLIFDRKMGEADMLGQAQDDLNVGHFDANFESRDLDLCIQQSIKVGFITKLLPELVEEGHKILIFSMSLRMLNLIASILKERLHIRFTRLDGRISKLADRQRILNEFQTSQKNKVMLLTTQVGGVGLTITAADRVIIMDPSWNPATDAQAVDRVYRVGQKNNVVVYRLITAGTIEEKIYRRQVFKQSVSREVVTVKQKQSSSGLPDLMRYFTSQDLLELFKLDDTTFSPTQRDLEQMHCAQRETDENLDHHLAWLYSVDIVGISDHNLLFTKADNVLSGLDQNDEVKINEIVRVAHDRIRVENDKARVDPTAAKNNYDDDVWGFGGTFGQMKARKRRDDDIDFDENVIVDSSDYFVPPKTEADILRDLGFEPPKALGESAITMLKKKRPQITNPDLEKKQSQYENYVQDHSYSDSESAGPFGNKFNRGVTGKESTATHQKNKNRFIDDEADASDDGDDYETDDTVSDHDNGSSVTTDDDIPSNFVPAPRKRRSFSTSEASRAMPVEKHVVDGEFDFPGLEDEDDVASPRLAARNGSVSPPVVIINDGSETESDGETFRCLKPSVKKAARRIIDSSTSFVGDSFHEPVPVALKEKGRGFPRPSFAPHHISTSSPLILNSGQQKKRPGQPILEKSPTSGERSATPSKQFRPPFSSSSCHSLSSRASSASSNEKKGTIPYCFNNVPNRVTSSNSVPMVSPVQEDIIEISDDASTSTEEDLVDISTAPLNEPAHRTGSSRTSDENFATCNLPEESAGINSKSGDGSGGGSTTPPTISDDGDGDDVEASELAKESVTEDTTMGNDDEDPSADESYQQSADYRHYKPRNSIAY